MDKGECAVEKLVDDLGFWRGKKVFLTGHTGFKGSWLCRILVNAGAQLTGFSLEPPTKPNLFSLCGVEDRMVSIIGEIRDADILGKAFKRAAPEIVIHMAAQPIVRDSYKEPAYTYDVNVMGTVSILECVRKVGGVRSFLNVTTDKVYQNREWPWGYRENDPLDGYDPYSNSKSCAELVTHSYKNSFFLSGETRISTARAGNVIGGGDFSNDRIIPDCVRAVERKEKIVVRNPYSIRPYQHVLEPLFAYLLIAQRQYEDKRFAGYYNVGPDDCDCASTGTLVDLFCQFWGEGAQWENISTEGPHEAGLLKLDCALLKSTFGWKPRWNIDKAVRLTVEWSETYLNGQDVCRLMDMHIQRYMDGE